MRELLFAELRHVFTDGRAVSETMEEPSLHRPWTIDDRQSLLSADEMNDDLEIGLAAGMDVPTAMISSEQEPPRKSGCGFFSMMMLVMLGLFFILKLILFEMAR